MRVVTTRQNTNREMEKHFVFTAEASEEIVRLTYSGNRLCALNPIVLIGRICFRFPFPKGANGTLFLSLYAIRLSFRGYVTHSDISRQPC